MKTSREILFKGRFLIEKAITAESRAQGHYLTGGLERSQTATVTDTGNGTAVAGEIAGYAQVLNNGFPASSASFKQFPFLVRYWKLRGLDDKSAKRAAAATIRKWMREGMPTASSFRYSRNGYREGSLDRSLTKAMPKVNDVITSALNLELKALINKTKSATI